MNLLKIAGLVAFTAVAGACAQPEPAKPVIQGEPLYDKYGGISGCAQGVYIPGAAPQDQCLPPQDDCRPTVGSSAAPDPCPPPRRPDDDREDRTPTGRGPGR